MIPNEILYKRDLTGNVVRWWARVERAVTSDEASSLRLAYYYGRLNGSETVSFSDIIKAKSKKTDKEQAEFELASVYEKHKKKGYKSLTDLGLNPLDYLNDIVPLWNEIEKRLPKYNTDANNCIKPMKCQKFAIGKFYYPAIIQPKINGVRAVVLLEEFTPTDLFSTEGFVRDDKHYHAVIKTKEGLVYNIWHIEQLFNHLYQAFPEYANVAFDGEIYIRGEKVTSIGGAARNSRNPLHKKLQFVNFDLSVPDLSNADRDELRFKIWRDYTAKFTSSAHNVMAGRIWENLSIEGHSMWDGFTLIVLNSNKCWDDNQALFYMQKAIEHGFEGAVIRDEAAEYKFGSRPSTMMKLKKFEDAEFECIGINHAGNPEDGIGFAVMLILKNDINDYNFTCTLTGTIQERLDILNNPPIGKQVTVKFYERTKNGIPFHANVIGIRDYEK